MLNSFVGNFDVDLESNTNELDNPSSASSHNVSRFEFSNGPITATNDLFDSTISTNNNKDAKDAMNDDGDEDSDLSEDTKKKRRFNFSLKSVFGKDGTKKKPDAQSKSNSTLLSKFRKLSIIGKRKTDLDSPNSSNIQLNEDSVSYNGESPCPYGCKNCGASFDEVGALAIHLKRGHCRRQVNSAFSTDFDEHSFSRSRSQSVSERAKSASGRHFGGEIREFKCNICHKMFAYKWNLQRHMKVHETEKKFSCEVCGKKFRHKGNVKIHMAKHTKETRYQCSKCDRKFSWHSSLKRHRCIPKQ